MKTATTPHGFHVVQAINGARVATGKTEAGTEVQFLSLGDTVVYGCKASDGKWVTMTVADPDRFGPDRSTVGAFAAWVEAFWAAEEEMA